MLYVVFALLAWTVGAHAKPRWETLPLPPAMPKAATTGHVASGDVEIYYATYGKGDPVILLHGGLGNSDHWAFQVPALAKHYQVIVVDSRNQGRSGFSKAKLSYRTMADDVLAVMDALGLGAAAIVGWSDGGEVALQLAVHHPKRVARLFVFGTAYSTKGSKPRTVPSQTFHLYTAKCKTDHARHKPRTSFDTVVSSLLPMWRGTGGFTKDQLRAITVPTVIADGDHDELFYLDHIKEMAGLIPNATLVVFEATSHFALWQDPEAFNRALLDFLAPARP